MTNAADADALTIDPTQRLQTSQGVRDWKAPSDAQQSQESDNLKAQMRQEVKNFEMPTNNAWRIGQIW